MGWLTGLGLTFGKTVAKSLAKYWLGDNFVTIFLEEGIDLGADQISMFDTKINTIETTIARVMQNLKPLFDAESINLSDSSQKDIVMSLSKTFVDVNSIFMVELNLDPEAIKNKLIEKYPDVTRYFSSQEEAVYYRMLDEVCKTLVKLAPKLESFDYAWTFTVLNNQDEILSLIDKLMRVPNDNDLQFEGRYRQAIARELDKVDFLGIGKIDDIVHSQSLSISYITLKVSSDFEESNKSSSKKRNSSLSKAYKTISNLRNASGDVNQYLSNGSRFVIRGEAGAGKTTLIHWIAVRSAKKDFSESLTSWNDLIPFVIHLRDYAKTEVAFPKPEEFPMEVAGMIIGDMPTGWVHRQLESQRAIVLIDGIDELPLDKRKRMLKSLSQLVDQYPFNHYIITSRPAALKPQDWRDWEKWIGQEEFLELSLQPMSTQQINNFIFQWHKALHFANIENEHDAIALAHGLQRIINNRPELIKLAKTPLLCTMICALYYDRRDSLPSDKRQLYKECIDILVDRREIKRGINLGVPLNIETKIKLLRYLAYWMLDNQDIQISTKIADEKFSKKIKEFPKIKGVTGKDFRIFMVERTNLLREPFLGQIEFAHRSFQEYLAAQYAVIDERNFGVLLKNAQNDHWRDVIILAIGEINNKKDRDNFLRRLLKLAQSSDNTQIKRKIQLIAAAGAEQSIESSSADVEQLIINAIKDIIPPKLDEVQLLASAGSRVTPLLKYRKSYRPEEIMACIRTLARIGSTEALELLEQYNSIDNAIVRYEIDNSWDLFDRYKYSHKILSKNNSFIRSKVLTTWDGFENLVNLEDVRINCGDKIKDISPLIKCEKLKKLSLCWNGYLDLRSIATLSLSELNIGLWAYNNLLVYNNSYIHNTPQLDMYNLDSLSIWSDYSESFAINVTPEKIQSLNLAGYAIQKIDTVENMTNLNELYLGVMPFHNAGRNVRVSKPTNIEKLPSFENLKNLKKICLGELLIDEIEELSCLEELKSLMLEKLAIDEIEILSELENLEELYIYSLNIDDLLPLKNMKKLKKLHIEDTAIDDISVLSNLNSLQEIIIKKSPIIDLEPINNLPNLEIVWAEDIPAKNLNLVARIQEIKFNPPLSKKYYH